MTEAQRLFLRVHPQFWLTRVASEDSSDGNETFEAAALHPQSGKPPGDTKPDLSGQPGSYFREADATAEKIKKLHVEHDNMEIDPDGGVPRHEPAVIEVAGRQRRPACVTHLETDIGKVFRGWSYVNAPYFRGEVGADVRRWLNTITINLKNRQAHPDVWHLAGIRLLQGKAYSDYEDSVALETDPLNWIDFCTWLEDLNPVTLSKQVVSDEYDALRMGNNESCQAFFDRFREWQSRAKNYSFQYEEISGFVARLTKPLNNKLLGLMAVEDRRGTPMTFAQVVMAALDKDRRWRKTSTVASTNGGGGSGPSSNKRASTGGDSQPKKKSTAPTHCFNCGKEGHVVAKCPDPKTEKQKAYEAQKGKPVAGPLN
jgi:hypothetical protein